MVKKGLGKGLNALLSDINSNADKNEAFFSVRINEVEPNVNQPRKVFNDEKLSELAESIKEHGIVQPIIVKKEDSIYRIIAGERRWRAARIAGLTEVPILIKELTDKEIMEIALIENLQREDLNSIEEAEAYENLMKEYNMTQEDMSKIIGKSRSAIANTIRLLSLSDKVKQFLMMGEITSGHGRALLSVEKKEEQEKLAELIIEKGLNVRDTEKLVKIGLSKKKTSKEVEDNVELNNIEEKLQNVFGTKVKIKNNSNNKGKILIEYYSHQELDRILDIVNSMNDNNIYEN